LAKLKAFSAYDGKLGVFMTPFFMQHTGQALRTWEDLVNNGDSIIAKHPSDFILYEVGSFEDDKGILIPQNPVHQVATALEVRREAPAKLPVKGM